METINYIANLDRAYEIVLLLWSILFAAFFQYMTWLWPKEEWNGVSSFVLAFFLVPLVIGILLWLYNQTTADPNQKMFYRVLSWFFSLANLWSYIAVICFIIEAGIAQSIPSSAMLGFLIALVFSVLIVPVLLWQFFSKIEALYKGESKGIDFWTNKGKWTSRKAQRIGYATVVIMIILIIAYVSIIRLS